MEVLSQCQQKRLHYSRLSEQDECPRTAKRSMTYRALQTSLHQVLYTKKQTYTHTHAH